MERKHIRKRNYTGRELYSEKTIRGVDYMGKGLYGEVITRGRNDIEERTT